MQKGDVIYRQQAIDALDGFRCGTKAAWKVIEDLPSAQPERKKGKWIRKTDTRFGEMLNDILICSECGIAFSTLNMIRRSYCPNCGARMEGEIDG